jgi:chromosome segregation ATPase
MEPESGDIESDDDELVENPVEVIREFGNHKLMQKAQSALISELKDTQYRLGIELIDKRQDEKNAIADREILGIQLYNLQQQLARLQISLENSHNEFNSIVEKRLQEEDLLKRVEENYAAQKSTFKEHEKQHKIYLGELDSLSETIRQIEAYNDEVQSEISITRRATYKAEQSIQNLEKYKDSQDSYVDNLDKQVKKLREQISLAVSQLESQKDETLEAVKVIEDTVKELEVISSEKKQLIIQWKAALVNITIRVFIFVFHILPLFQFIVINFDASYC